MTGRRRDRGQATIEMVGLLPMVLIIMVLVFQVMTMIYTAHAASQAARDGARAYSLGQSPESAARASLPGGVSYVSTTTFGPGHGVRVTVNAPALLFIRDRAVTGEVTMP
jgi:hypothetical protein